MPVEDQQLPSTYTLRVGERMRSVRNENRLSLQAVEARSGGEFKVATLESYERGDRSISVARLRRLAGFYGVPVDQLLPRDLGSDLEHYTGEIDCGVEPEEAVHGASGMIMIDLGAVQAANAPAKDLLRRYLGLLQVRHRDFNGRVLAVRAEDLKVLALMLETTPAGLQRRLEVALRPGTSDCP